MALICGGLGLSIITNKKAVGKKRAIFLNSFIGQKWGQKFTLHLNKAAQQKTPWLP